MKKFYFYSMVFVITVFLCTLTDISMGGQEKSSWHIIKTTGNNNNSNHSIKSLPSKKVINSIANREASNQSGGLYNPPPNPMPSPITGEQARQIQEGAARQAAIEDAARIVRDANNRVKESFHWGHSGNSNTSDSEVDPRVMENVRNTVNNAANKAADSIRWWRNDNNRRGNSQREDAPPSPLPSIPPQMTDPRRGTMEEDWREWQEASQQAGREIAENWVNGGAEGQGEETHDAAVSQRAAEAASDAVRDANDRIRDSFRWGHGDDGDTSGSGSDSGFWGNIRDTVNNTANNAAENAADIADANQRASEVAEDINDSIRDSFRWGHGDDDNKSVPVIGPYVAGSVVPADQDSVTVVNAIPPGGIIGQLEPPSDNSNPAGAQDNNQGNPDSSVPANPPDNTTDPNVPADNQTADNTNSGNSQGNNGTVNIPIPGINALGSDSVFGDLPAPVNPYPCGETIIDDYIPVTGNNYVSCNTAGVTADSFNVCLLNNAFINILINMDLGIADMYFMGNHMFRMCARYVDVPGFSSGNVIELKGNGQSKMFLIKSRKVLYFRNGVIGSFADVQILS